MTAVEGRTDMAPWSGAYRPEHREDRWIVGRLNRAIENASRSLEGFELGEAQQQLYDFIWNDFCDWYIEMAKIRIRSGAGPSPLPTLAHVLERTLRLLHPFMPFITEEIWQNLVERLPDEGGLAPSVMVSDYPTVEPEYEDSRAEGEISLIMQTVRAVRNTRAQLRIPAGQYLEAVVEADGFREAIEEEAEVIPQSDPHRAVERSIPRRRRERPAQGHHPGGQPPGGASAAGRRGRPAGGDGAAAEGNWPTASATWTGYRRWSPSRSSWPKPAPTWWKRSRNGCGRSRNASSGWGRFWPSWNLRGNHDDTAAGTRRFQRRGPRSGKPLVPGTRQGSSWKMGNLLQASEKVWGATAHALKAMALQRGWHHRSHATIFDIGEHLGREFDREERFGMISGPGRRHAHELLREQPQ